MLTLFYYKKVVIYEKTRTNKTRVERNKRQNWWYRRKTKATKKSRKENIKTRHSKKKKNRTHRLITRGAILESLIENAEELTDEEIKILIEKAKKTKEFKETLKIMRAN